MLSLIFSMNIFLSILFPLLKHPLSMGMILLSQTISISMITGNMNLTFWFSYILFLIMVGGMLILFMYMTSIASNEKFKTNLYMTMIILIMPMAFIIDPNPTIKNSETFNFSCPLEFQLSMNKFINLPLTWLFLFLILYLLLTLIATVKISSFKMGSIRQMN